MVVVVERIRHDGEKIFLHLGISINRRDKGLLWGERRHLLILLDSVGDVGSLHFSLVGEALGMYDVHDLDSLFASVFADEALGVFGAIGNTSLCRKEYGDIFFVWIFGRDDREDILLDDVIRLSIDGDDDDVLELSRVLCHEWFSEPIPLFVLEELPVRLQDVVVGLKYLDRPIRDIERDKK